MKRCKRCFKIVTGIDDYCSGACKSRKPDKHQPWVPVFKNRKRKFRKLQGDTSKYVIECKRLQSQVDQLKLEVASLKKGRVPSFYDSQEWRELRYRALKEKGRKCVCCGATYGQFHVDHIKPRSRYPELSLSFDNLQVLCRDCNLGKSNYDEIKW